MQLTSFLEAGKLTVALTGEIDHHRAKSYIQAISGKIEAYNPNICILDFGEVTFMDSSGIAVVINVFRLQENGVWEVNLDIVCERASHKAILIGKQGKAIKEVSSFARQDMEKFLGAKVFLTTYVKVKEDWRDRPNLLKQYGYEENEEF
jgi:anti-anti-sigma factor